MSDTGAERTHASGIALRSIAQILEGRDAAERDQFARELYEAEAPMWDDVPWATPTPHWPFDRFHTLLLESSLLIAEASIIAYDRDKIVGLTLTGKRLSNDGDTWLTGTGREHRARGLATAMKVEALARAKARGLRALLTTNDGASMAAGEWISRQRLPAERRLDRLGTVLSRSTTTKEGTT